VDSTTRLTGRNDMAKLRKYRPADDGIVTDCLGLGGR
jgi:hypothetical protein